MSRQRSRTLTLGLSLLVALAAATALQGSHPTGTRHTQTLGEIRWFAFNFAPRGWRLCDGQLLPINGNAALFSLLGTTYGGDGQTTFAVPDLLEPHFPDGPVEDFDRLTPSIAVFGIFPSHP